MVGSAIALRVVLWLLDPNPLLYGDSGSYVSAALNPQPYIIHPKGVSLLWSLAGVSVLRIVLAQTALTIVMCWSVWEMSKRFWVVALILLNPLTLAYERTLLSEHLFATLVALGVALTLRRNVLAGLVFGLAAVTRSVGVLLFLPFLIAVRRDWRLLIVGSALFVVPIAVYVARYVQPSTGAWALTFLGPNAITVVAPLAECPPAPPDICAWQGEHPNAIAFHAQGPVQTRLRAVGWRKTDDQLLSVVRRAIADHPLEYVRMYLGRIPHLFSLQFHYDHGASDTHYGYSAQMLEKIDGKRARPLKTAGTTRSWHVAVRAGTVVAGAAVIWAFASGPSLVAGVSAALLLLGSIAFNDATGRFLYPTIAILLPYVRRPRGTALARLIRQGQRRVAVTRESVPPESTA